MRRVILGVILPAISGATLIWSVVDFHWVLLALSAIGLTVSVFWQFRRVTPQDNDTIENIIRMIATVLNLNFFGKYNKIVKSILALLVSLWVYLSTIAIPDLCVNLNIGCDVDQAKWYIMAGLIITTVQSAFGLGKQE